MRFVFIDAEKANYPVVVLCRVMQVRRSGFCAWRRRSPSKRARADMQLTGQIAQAFAASRGTYGIPRVRVELHANGIVASKRRVTQLMRKQGMYALRKRRFIHTTDSKHKLPIAPNLLARNFTAEAPNRVWVTDITCIWTLQGWLFLAVILDLFSRRIVGWSMSKNIDEGLILGALRMALLNRNPKASLIHHSDRGSVYCASDYIAVLQAYGIERSMSRKADCWDIAVAESFFGTLKQELVFRLKLQSRAATRTAIFEYMEGYYNSRRRHATLGFLIPIDFEGSN